MRRLLIMVIVALSSKHYVAYLGVCNVKQFQKPKIKLDRAHSINIFLETHH